MQTAPTEVLPHSVEILQRFDLLNVALLSKGFPAISPWWRATIGRWYESGKRQLVARVGRRGGKSSTLCRLAVVEALYGKHDIPPGDVGVVAIVSARRTDALERLRTIKAILDVLKVKYDAKVESVELREFPIVFSVFTASISGVSGFTSIFVFCDEVAKWRDAGTGANPASVVITSIRPTVMTMPNARIVLSSSPMGPRDVHAAAFAEGETAMQLTAHAPTWEANPTVSECATRELEAHPAVWAREYAAIPQDESEDSLLTSVMLNGVTRTTNDASFDERHTYTATLDTRSDSWTLAIGCLSDRSVRRVALVREFPGPIVPSSVMAAVRLALKPYNLTHVHCPDFAEHAMREQSAGLSLVTAEWSAASLAGAYESLKTIAQESKLDLPGAQPVRAALLGIRAEGAGYTTDSSIAPAVAMLLPWLRVAPTPGPTTLLEDEAAFRAAFLKDREKARKRAERHGPLPVTHLRRKT